MLTYPALTNQIAGNTSGATAFISSGTMILAGGNNITLSQAGNAITISGGAGGAGDGLNRISAGTQLADTMATVLFNNNAAITFGMANSSVITATHNGITTGRASNDAIGLNTAGSNMTWTANSAGLSIDARGYAGTVTGGTNATVTANSNGVSVSVGNYITTARASNDAIGLNTANSNVTWTANSAGLSLDARGYAGTGTSATNASVTLNSNGLAISVAAPGGGAAVTVSDAAGSGTVGRLAFTNLNGITLSLSTGAAGSHTIVGSHNALTTARASNDGIGLNTAQSNVTWTANSGGLSFDARGYAGTGTTFGANGLSASITLNSAGFNMSLSDGTGALTVFATSNTTQSSSGTVAESSMIFAGAGIASVGVSNGSVVISVPAGGGAGDGGVFAGVSNLGNTAGSTGTVSTGNFVLVGSNGISLSQSTGAAGSAATITINGNAPISLWNNQQGTMTTGPLLGNSNHSVFPVLIQDRLAASQAKLLVSLNVGTAANNSSCNANLSATGVLYSLNGATLSSILSGSTGLSQSWSSNATGTVTGAQQVVFTYAGTTLAPGMYWWGIQVSTANAATGAATTNLGVSASMIFNGAGGVVGARPWGVGTNASYGAPLGQGILGSAATRSNIELSLLNATGTNAPRAALYIEMGSQSVY